MSEANRTGSERSVAERAAEASRVLARAGVDARVTVAGQAGDIAAVAATPERLPEVAAHVPAIRALGFRYVALEIAPPTESASG